MEKVLRKKFNDSFSNKDYEALCQDINSRFASPVGFRIAETPIFLTTEVLHKLVEGSGEIIGQILRHDFKENTQRAIPASDLVSNETPHPHCICIDFGICEKDGKLHPYLIEIQGFPSLYCWQLENAKLYKKHYGHLPKDLTCFFNGHDEQSFLELFRKTILGKHLPKEVILLEVKPHEQKTNIDFYLTQEHTGVRPVCLTELIREGNQLFYMLEGQKQHIKRIYNRLIFDDLNGYPDLEYVDIKNGVEVEWVSHPNWFYRISKFTLPLLSGEVVPESHFLSDVDISTVDLGQYVLKPLFSFAGQGVVINVTKADVDAIADKENWLLQRKVTYADAIETPTGNAKCEIRMLYLWEDGSPEPELVLNLSRISKGEMIGTRYNKDFDWVGGSVGFFPKQQF